jgi:hypothetical protein
MSLCQPSDLVAFGVPRGATPNPGRVLASLAGSVCTLDVHGLDTGTAILFRAAGAGVLPSPLSEGVTYYAESLTEHTFRVRATAGGPALTLTDTDDPIMVIVPLPIAEAIAWAEQVIYDSLPAHAVPIAQSMLVPELLRMTCAELAAGKLLAISGAASRSLSETVDMALKRVERWGKGVPLRDPNAPARTNLAASASSPPSDARGWRRYGGIGGPDDC